MTQNLGRLEIAEFPLQLLRSALITSFEARRGKLFDTILALNALAIHDLGISGIADLSLEGGPEGEASKNDDFAQSADRLVFEALQRQLEPELLNAFQYQRSLAAAKRNGGRCWTYKEARASRATHGGRVHGARVGRRFGTEGRVLEVVLETKRVWWDRAITGV